MIIYVLFYFAVEYANGSLSGQSKTYHPDFLPAAQVSSVDNPEYHLTSDEPNTATTTIPNSSTDATSELTVEPQSPVPTTTTTTITTTATTTTTGRSLEDESDHEYYNDFDRLQRELQPLRRNETTV